MKKEPYKLLTVRSGAMLRAAEKYNANMMVDSKVSDDWYNTGTDEVLKDIAISILAMREEERERIVGEEHPVKEFVEEYNNLFSILAKNLKEDEELKNALFELDSRSSIIEATKAEFYFIEGFIAGYKMLKNANYA